MIDKEYIEKMKRINDLPLSRAALKFLPKIYRGPISGDLPYAFQVVKALELKGRVQQRQEIMEYLTEVVALDDPEEMIEPLGLMEEFHLWPKNRQTPMNLARHVLESIQNEMIEKNLL